MKNPFQILPFGHGIWDPLLAWALRPTQAELEIRKDWELWDAAKKNFPLKNRFDKISKTQKSLAEEGVSGNAFFVAGVTNGLLAGRGDGERDELELLTTSRLVAFPFAPERLPLVGVATFLSGCGEAERFLLDPRADLALGASS